MRLRSFRGTAVVAAAIGILLGVTACGTAGTQVRSAGSTPAAPALAPIDAPVAPMTYKHDQITIAPPREAAPVSVDEASTAIEANSFVSALLKDGLKGTISFVSYTNSTYGSADPAAIAKVGLANAPVALAYVNTPAWVVTFTNVPAGWQPGGKIPVQSNAGSGDAPTSQPTPIGAGETLMMAFSADGSSLLLMSAF